MILYYIWDRFLRPFPELDEERIEELLREICVSFASSFPESFKDALLQHRLSQESTLIISDSQDGLLQAPKRTYIIKVGFLWKRGAQMKNWKRRYFRSLNETDNYNIVYADDEYVSKPKGVICLSGYRVEAFTEAETQLYGPFGLKLVPAEENTRRVWWLRAENETERVEWEEVLTNACSRAKPTRESDPVVSAAFLQSFKDTRRSYGYYGHVNTQQLSEVQLLVELVHAILMRETLHDYYASLPNTVYRDGFIADTKKHINDIVLSAVESLWQSCLNHEQNHRISVDNVTHDQILSILRTEEEIANQLQTLVYPIVHPVVCDLLSRACIPLMHAITEPIDDILFTALQEFQCLLKQCILLNYIQYDNKSVDQSCSILYRDIDNESSGAFSATRQKLWEMYTTKLDDSMFPEDFSVYEFFELVKSHVLALLSNAVYTFIHEANRASSKDAHELKRNNRDSISAASLNAILASVMGRLIHDVKVGRSQLLLCVLRRLIASTAEEMIYEPCSDVIISLASVIPTDISNVLNLPITGERIVSQMVDKYLLSLVDEAILDVGAMSQLASL